VVLFDRSYDIARYCEWFGTRVAVDLSTKGGGGGNSCGGRWISAQPRLERGPGPTSKETSPRRVETIYDQRLLTRTYEVLEVNVNPGNSGRPVLVGGDVAGVVESKSLSEASTAYAIPDLDA